LADAMGISYQAVSNWERGNSMPDIAKLPELCNILELNVDQLIGNGETVQTVKKMISEKDAVISLEELADVAPIVPPKKMEQVLENNAEGTDYIDVDALIALAPFLDEEYLSQLAKRISLDHLEQLVGLAPFINRDVLNQIALDYDKTYEGTLDAIIALAPFLRKETLSQIVENCLAVDEFDLSDLVGLCPFLKKDTIRRIADFIMNRKDFDSLSKIAPFM